MLRNPAAFVFVALVGCSSSVGSGEPAPSVPVATSAPAIAKIVTRDRSITLFAAHGTVNATVLDGNGKLLARDVDIDALQNIDASAYDACHSSFAGKTVPEDEKPPTGAPRIGW
jgi:hypothetical protein